MSVDVQDLIPCNVCDFEAENDNELKEHVQNRHERKIVQHQCDVCGFITKERETLSNHQKLNHVEQKKEREAIRNTNDGNDNTAVLDDPLNLSLEKTHVLDESSSIPESITICGECGKGFSDEESANDHIQEHNFKCTVCNFENDDQNKVEEHALKHTLFKLFKCDTCGSRYSDNATQA